MNIHCPTCEADALVTGERRLLDHWTAIESAQCSECGQRVGVPMRIQHRGQCTADGVVSSTVHKLVSLLDDRSHDPPVSR